VLVTTSTLTTLDVEAVRAGGPVLAHQVLAAARVPGTPLRPGDSGVGGRVLGPQPAAGTRTFTGRSDRPNNAYLIGERVTARRPFRLLACRGRGAGCRSAGCG
jgi:hypothetical protein